MMQHVLCQHTPISLKKNSVAYGSFEGINLMLRRLLVHPHDATTRLSGKKTPEYLYQSQSGRYLISNPGTVPNIQSCTYTIRLEVPNRILKPH